MLRVGILGVRRGGKTSLMYLIINDLLKQVNKENILFIKGDDDRVEKKDLISKSIEKYKELINPKGKIFIFIDEVQETGGWESALKRIYDLEKDIKFFISGSNFSLSKEDLSYKLAGRIAYFDLYPMSFKESLSLKPNVMKDKVTILSKSHEIKHYLLEYAEFGGFPEVVLEKDHERKKQLLQFYYDTIVYRDIIKRREIRNTKKMESMIDYFLQNISNLINFTKVGKQISLSTDSVGEYTKYLQEAFLMFNISLLAFSVKKQEINPKKVYCVDTGIRNVKGFRFSQDYGRLIENMVFIELKRRNSANPLVKIFYWQNREGEVDFIIKDGVKVDSLIQVCWDVENEITKNREVNSLINGMKEFKLNNGLIITERYEKEELVKGKKIKFIPLWKWLLQN